MTKHLYCILLGKFIYQSRKLLLNNIFVQSIQYCSVRKKIYSLYRYWKYDRYSTVPPPVAGLCTSAPGAFRVPVPPPSAGIGLDTSGVTCL